MSNSPEWLVAALAVLTFAIAPAAARSDFARAKALLNKSAPFVLVAVPQEFLAPDKIDGDEIETQSDWAHYLEQFENAHRDIPVVIISLSDYRKLVTAPTAKDKCMNLFVRAGMAALYDQECAAIPYNEGLAWLHSSKLVPNGSLRVMKLQLRPTSR